MVGGEDFLPQAYQLGPDFSHLKYFHSMGQIKPGGETRRWRQQNFLAPV